MILRVEVEGDDFEPESGVLEIRLRLSNRYRHRSICYQANIMACEMF